MNLWKKVTDLMVTRFLRFNADSKIVITQSPGAAEVNITARKLATLSPSGRFVAAGATLTLTVAEHDGKIICFDTAAGSVVTLPTSSGSGAEFHFCTTVIATSNDHIVKVANATDVMSGSLQVVDNNDGTCTSFGTVAASDTITLNRTTKGSVKIGEFFTITDVKAGYFSVRGTVIATGSEATPFSASVS